MFIYDVFVCLWEGCKVFDKLSLLYLWLLKYVNVYIGVKFFKCMISGCFMIFFLREGLVRYVLLYFNDFKLVKR